MTALITIEMPDDLAQHYRNKSRDTGKSVSELVVSDIEQYHEYRRYQDNYREKTHP